MILKRRRVMLAALAVAAFGALGTLYLMPRHGVCVDRNLMFWRAHVRATPLRNNVYMLSAYGTDLVQGNTTALVGDDGVLLVDPGHPEMVGKERAALPDLKDPRVRLVVDSHGHFDHACANSQLFNDGAIIIGHGSIWNYLAEASSWHSRRRGDAPQVTFENALTLRFDGEQVRLIHTPPAHTDGDTITVFPRANVIHTGDIFVNGTFPYMENSDIDGYIAAEELLLKLADDNTLIVPGHGPLARKADVQKSLDRMREVRKRIALLTDQGLTRKQMLARHPLDDLQPGPSREVLGSQAVAGFVFTSMTKSALKRAGKIVVPHVTPARAVRSFHN